jgi:hypothetical protein
MAEDVFKNIQVLRGISVDEFMGTMGFFSAALGMNCVDCHTSESVGDWAKFADDTEYKQTARKMVLMVRTINQANFGGARRVTCYSCHRGMDLPKVTPSLAQQYEVPPPDDPDEVQVLSDAAVPGALTAEQVLDKYVQAVGGAAQLAKLDSFTAKGTYVGYDSDQQEVPMELYVRAPDMRAMVVHTLLGDDFSGYDGREGWAAGIHQPLPVVPRFGGDLYSLRVDALLSIPALIKQDFAKWRTGFPDVSVDGHELRVIEGTMTGGFRVKLYFDKESGLLVRQVRYANTLVGLNPTHIEYSDYRFVDGVKLPFRWVTTWTDGQSTMQLTSVQANVAIDPAKFARPSIATNGPTGQRHPAQ